MIWIKSAFLFSQCTLNFLSETGWMALSFVSWLWGNIHQIYLAMPFNKTQTQHAYITVWFCFTSPQLISLFSLVHYSSRISSACLTQCFSLIASRIASWGCPQEFTLLQATQFPMFLWPLLLTLEILLDVSITSQLSQSVIMSINNDNYKSVIIVTWEAEMRSVQGFSELQTDFKTSLAILARLCLKIESEENTRNMT